MAQSDYESALTTVGSIRHYWKLTETSGTAFADSGAGAITINGTSISAAGTTGPDGVAKAVLHPGGSGKYLASASALQLNSYTVWTWIFWFKAVSWPASGTSAKIAELIDAGASTSYMIVGKDVYSPADSLGVACLMDSVTTSANNSTTKPATGGWHMLAITFDSALSGTAKMKVYLDGTSIGTSTNVGTPGGSLTNNDKLSLLARGVPFGVAGSGALDGAVSNVSFHNKAASSTEVTTLYNNMVGANASVTAVPLAATVSQPVPVAAVYPIADAMTDTNGTALSSHVPTGGFEVWSRTTGTTSATLKVTSNRVYVDDPVAIGASVNYALSQSASDGVYQFDAVTVGTLSGSDAAYMWARWTPPGANNEGYQFGLEHNSGTPQLVLYKVTGGGFSTLGTPYSTGALSGTYTVRLEAVGSSLTVYLNGTSRITATDATFASGRVGLQQVTHAAAGTGNGLHIDSVSVSGANASTASPALAASASLPTPTVTGLTTTIAAVPLAAAVTLPVPTLAYPNLTVTGPTTFGIAGSESTGRTGGTKPHRGFPGICTLASGNLLRVYRRATSHTSLDGDLCTEISTDNGATWGSETVIRAATDGFPGGSPVGNASQQEGLPLVLTTGANAGKVLITGWCNNGTVYKAFSMLSTDSTATAWGSPVNIAHSFGGGTDYVNCSSPAVQDPSTGDLFVALAGLEQAASTDARAPYRYSVRISYSTDDGTSWSAYANVANPTTTTGPTYDEPYMLLLPTGEMIMTIRQASSIDAYGSYAPDTNVHIWRSPNYGLAGPWTNWTEQGRAFDDMGTTTAMGQKNVTSPARASLVQDARGEILLTHRIYIYNTTSPYYPGNIGTANGAWRSSSDNGVTFGPPLDLHSGKAATTTTQYRQNADGTASATQVCYDYAMGTVMSDGNIGVVWGEENTAGTTANLFFRQFNGLGGRTTVNMAASVAIPAPTITTSSGSASPTITAVPLAVSVTQPAATLGSGTGTTITAVPLAWSVTLPTPIIVTTTGMPPASVSVTALPGTISVALPVPAVVITGPGTLLVVHPQGMVPGTTIGAYRRWEWKGPVAAKLNAGPGAAVQETTVASDLTASFTLLPGEYVAYAPTYPTKRLFFMVTE